MNSKFKATANMAMGLLFGLSLATTTQAEMIAPPNLMASANMSFDQRLAEMHKISLALSKATPEERNNYALQIGAQIKAMSPKDQELLAAKLTANSKAMTPQQLKALKAEQGAYFKSLPADQQMKVAESLKRIIEESRKAKQPS